MNWTGDDEEWMGRENEEYRRLTLQHHEFQEKLFVKDRMAAIRREHAASKRSAPEPA